ncbi:MAG TPA: penicillin-binding transpeptidase domain-containing protein, partial [Actinomycetota bacterium]|nr:penicillin-binding transpeptidase domain-containing protein [Actinomycetota bacterium]
MERRIRRLGIALVLLFAVLFGQLAYVQVFAADDIKGNPANFSRQLIAEYNVQRGKILTQDGLVLAESVPAPEGSRYRYERQYPQGDLYGHITGFYSRIFGRSSLEQSMNTYFSGEAPELAISTFGDLLLGRPKRGANVFVTIVPELQEAARTALAGNEGAVVAMDPRTGDIQALYSTPGFDPNDLSNGTDRQIRRAWDRLNAAEDKPLLALSHQELFLPGSSFK